MRITAALEGATLLILLLVAVPLKYLAGLSAATRVVGPVHGLAFVLYIWTLTRAAAGGLFTRGETIRLLVGAFVPFGGIFNERALARRARRLPVNREA